VNAGAQFFIPTVDQWDKAAYYRGRGCNAGYWSYAKQSDAVPGNVIGSGTNQVNYYDGSDLSVTRSGAFDSNENYLTDVAAFSKCRGGRHARRAPRATPPLPLASSQPVVKRAFCGTPGPLAKARRNRGHGRPLNGES
jgi:hypothetical protein